MTFTSEDVLHDLYIPVFRVKADAIPGRYSSIWFTPTKTGEYPPVLRRVLRHQALRDDRHASSSWSRTITRRGSSGGGLTGSMAARGEQLFQQLACNTCHLNDGTGRGPSLAGVFGSPVKLDDGQTVDRRRDATSASRS